MPPKKGAAKKPRAPKGGHQLAAQLPLGTSLTDFKKQTWLVGKPVGSGGFGLIYLASPADQKGEEKHVMKVEPMSNGPLFCELNFYQRAAKPEMVSTWMKEHKVKSLGMPKFIAAGMLDRNGTKYRFMVMERFGTDLQKLFETNNKSFPLGTVLNLGIKVIDVLEYIHDQGFVHADIKAANILLGYGKQNNMVYLVDYGLAYRYIPDGVHKEYKEDPKRCHDGTIEFTSRDAHLGATPSRRGDLEILGYCMVQWLCGKLPWESNLDNKEYVRDQKIKYMKDVPLLLKACFPGKKPPDGISEYLEYVRRMRYTDVPDYNQCRQMFRTALKKNGYHDDKLIFTAAKPSTSKPAAAKSPTKPKATPRSRKRVSTSPDDFSDSDPELSPPPAKQRGRTSSTGTPAKARKAPAKAKVSASKKSPAAEARAKVPAKKSPNTSRAKVSAAAKKIAAKSVVNGNVHGTPAKKSAGATKRKIAADVVNAATQTSPGLKGLKRSWAKRAKQQKN